MPILGIIASSKLTAVPSSYESIATVTVGSGGSASVSFTSIPATYTHLQVRCLTRSDFSGSEIDSLSLRLNSDTGSNYAYHYLEGYGSGVNASGLGSQTVAIVGGEISNGHTAGMFSGFVIDFLDYANTNKTKTIRSLGGGDTNNTGTEKGVIRFSSALWNNTAAINEITFKSGGGFTRGFIQYSHFALYGIKGS
jgi:hypothetical protein